MISPQVPPPGLVREEAPDSVRDHLSSKGRIWGKDQSRCHPLLGCRSQEV